MKQWPKRDVLKRSWGPSAFNTRLIGTCQEYFPTQKISATMLHHIAILDIDIWITHDRLIYYEAVIETISAEMQMGAVSGSYFI
jgi:hypothetical protein